MISTRNLAGLPNIEALRQRMQQMAALVAVFDNGSGEPTFAFYPEWSRSSQLGTIKSGSGDELFVHFTRTGCFIKGFAHESVMTPYRTKPPELWPGLFSSVPPGFQSSLKEPAFDIPATTFVVWRLAAGDAWHTDTIEYPDHYYGDGSEDLLSPLEMSPAEFAEWLAENYEVEVDGDIVDYVFSNQPLVDAHLATLNPAAKIEKLRKAVSETGYALV